MWVSFKHLLIVCRDDVYFQRLHYAPTVLCDAQHPVDPKRIEEGAYVPTTPNHGFSGSSRRLLSDASNAFSKRHQQTLLVAEVSSFEYISITNMSPAGPV